MPLKLHNKFRPFKPTPSPSVGGELFPLLGGDKGVGFIFDCINKIYFGQV